jgi:hypothetical protein
MPKKKPVSYKMMMKEMEMEREIGEASRKSTKKAKKSTKKRKK